MPSKASSKLQRSRDERQDHELTPTKKAKQPYEATGGLPRLRQSIVAYIDILGFREEMLGAERSGSSEAFLQRVVAVVEGWYRSWFCEGPGERYGVPRGWALKVFSDNVIIGYPIEQGGEIELGDAMGDVAMLQLALAAEGFFVRGGMVLGYLYMDDYIVHGKALLDAVEAEKHADVPRVVLDDHSLKLVRRQVRNYREIKDAPHGNFLLRDEDGCFFVNYLGRAWQHHWGRPDYSIIERHRDLVIERLSMFSGKSKIWAKYHWVARYHNYVCSELIPGADRFKIEGQLLPLQARQIHQAFRHQKSLRKPEVPPELGT